jgi:hypothetical protein
MPCSSSSEHDRFHLEDPGVGAEDRRKGGEDRRSIVSRDSYPAAVEAVRAGAEEVLPPGASDTNSQLT